MKKQVLACFLLVLCVLLTACEDANPAEMTPDVTTTVIPVETTTAVTTTAPVETTVAVTSAEASGEPQDVAPTQQANALTEHLIRDVMDKTWLEDGYTCTDADIFRFLLSLCMYSESTTHPYADIVTVSADQQAYQIRLADAKRIASELFDEENWTEASCPTDAYDSATACYRTPMGIGAWGSPFAYEDMTAYTAGDLVHVQCTLVNSKLFPYEEIIYGKYDFVFRYISDDGKNHLQFAGLEKTK